MNKLEDKLDSMNLQDNMKKRDDYISWDEYFMAVSFLSAMRSKDPKTQVGACIVNVENKIVGVGYNGMPLGCSDDEMPWGREGDNPLQSKYLFVCHAELNAILNKNAFDVKGCRIYVALFPCNECAKVIVNSGIKEVIYMSDKKLGTTANTASKIMLKKAAITCSRGYHANMALWTPNVGEKVTLAQDSAIEYPERVSLLTNDNVIIGHVPLYFCKWVYRFLKKPSNTAIAVVTDEPLNRGAGLGKFVPSNNNIVIDFTKISD